jgi:flagellin-like protein
MNRKGISPLVAVIMLIAITLIVSGILATWVTQIAQSQRGKLEYCMDASVLIQGARYDSGTQTLYLYIDNRGNVNLNFTAILTFSDDTAPIKSSTLFPVEAKKLDTMTITSVPNTLREATIQSDECPGAQDLIQRRGIKGLGF